MLRVASKQAPEEVPADIPLEVEEAPDEEFNEAAEEVTEPSMGGTVDPAVARYFDSSSMCSGCIHFDGQGACEIVAGPIDPEGICSLFTPDVEEEPLDEGVEEEVVEE